MQAAAIGKSLPAIEVLCRGAAQMTCAVGNIVICLSEQTPEQSYLDAYVQAINAFGRKYPNGLGMMVLIAADEPPPDDRARRAIRASHLCIKGSVRLCVLVVEGEGFAASAKRSIISMLSMGPLQPFPHKVAGTIREGAAKLAKLLGPHLDPQLDAEALATAATRVRQGLA